MIERFSIAATAAQLASRFGTEEPASFHARYNVAPAQLLPVITSAAPQGFSYFYWGLPPQQTKNKAVSEKVINTRVEFLVEKLFLRRTLRTHRGIVPADGFYCWKRVGKKTLIPWRVCLKDKGLFSIPVLWEEYDDTNGEMVHTFSIITRPAEEGFSLHDRMPVIFTAKEEQVWLNQPSEEEALLSVVREPQRLPFEDYAVSPQLNDIQFDRPSLILPTPPADQFGNLTLFDS